MSAHCAPTGTCPDLAGGEASRRGVGGVESRRGRLDGKTADADADADADACAGRLRAGVLVELRLAKDSGPLNIFADQSRAIDELV